MRDPSTATQPIHDGEAARSRVPESPKARRLSAPRWLDARLVLGLVLVLGSVAIGTRVIASVGDTQLVWAAAADLAAGTRLAGAHLDRVEVRLTGDTPARYLDAGRPPVGYVLTRPLGKGELVPAAAVAMPDEIATEWRFVTVPVQQYHYPSDLRAGELVDVYVTRHAEGGDGQPAASLVAPALTVSAVHGGGRSGFGASAAPGVAGIELSVPAAESAALVEALQSGPIDLVRVPSGNPS